MVGGDVSKKLRIINVLLATSLRRIFSFRSTNARSTSASCLTFDLRVVSIVNSILLHWIFNATILLPTRRTTVHTVAAVQPPHSQAVNVVSCYRSFGHHNPYDFSNRFLFIHATFTRSVARNSLYPQHSHVDVNVIQTRTSLIVHLAQSRLDGHWGEITGLRVVAGALTGRLNDSRTTCNRQLEGTIGAYILIVLFGATNTVGSKAPSYYHWVDWTLSRKLMGPPSKSSTDSTIASRGPTLAHYTVLSAVMISTCKSITSTSTCYDVTTALC